MTSVELVLADPLHPEARQVVDGRAEPDGRGDVRCAGLELPGDRVPLAPAQVDLADHLAAGEERRHRLEQLAARPEDARTHRRQHLVAAEDVEIGAEILHVDGQVRHGLRTVDQHQRSYRMRHLDHLADRVDRSERVRHLREGDELRTEPQEHLVDLEAQERRRP